MHRRTLIAGSASLVATSLVRAQSANDVFTEYQRGDPDAEYGTVIIDPQKIEHKSFDHRIEQHLSPKLLTLALCWSLLPLSLWGYLVMTIQME
jgi:hypothetical protein